MRHLLLPLLLLLAACHTAPTAVMPPITDTPETPQSTHPLAVGDRAPTADLLTPDNRTVHLADLYASKPTILIFYRGGWCPYCNKHLAQIAQIEPRLIALGYQVLAVSPDRPEFLQPTLDKNDLHYQLLSDSDMTLARRFGLAFRLDDATLARYRAHGLDLSERSGNDHPLLPIPALYILDTHARIRFAHADPDYTQRLDPQSLLTAAEKAAR
ncbi:MAG: AhpC/TSA family protein [Phycisphaeraceae bacterium]|nr:AhpC/TSA family protein [Phycisphaeraceae bacterium]